MDNESNFTWIPFFKAIHKAIHEKYDKYSLANLANEIFGNKIHDRKVPGEDCSWFEATPINFLLLFNREFSDENKKHYCKLVIEKMKLKGIQCPEDFNGVPSTQHLNHLCLSYSYERNENDVDYQWKFSENIYKNTLGKNKDSFNKLLKIANLNIGYISNFLFCINPEKYFPYTKITKGSKAINSYDSYMEYCNQMTEKSGMLPYEYSYNQYLKKVSARENSYSLFWELWSKLSKQYGDNIQLSGLKHKIEYIKYDGVEICSFTKHTKQLEIIEIIIDGEIHTLDSKDMYEKVIKKLTNKIADLGGVEIKIITKEKKETNNNGENDITSDKQPLNQILYGPPGTGKTYNTVVKAMEIIGIPENPSNDYNEEEKEIYKRVFDELNSSKNKKEFDNKEYKILKKEFDKLLGSQIEFITFHQSYSYEEFVEGIKPYIPEWGEDNAQDVKYVGKNGLFKKICDRAKPIKTDGAKHEKIDFNNAKIYKMSLGDSTNKEEADIYEYCIENNCIALGYTNKNFETFEDINNLKKEYNDTGINEINTFRFKMDDEKNKDRIVIVSKGNNFIRAIARIKNGGDGDYYYKSEADTGISYTHFRNVDWLYVGENIEVSKIYNKNIIQKSAYELDISCLNKDFINDLITGDINNYQPENYVLIIDEINRGNISKIFGELITLIEYDKRKNVTGDDESKYNTITVTLPYSGKPFFVPNNLYIIGTMNTADRSIALLDTALRRRFDFEEMPPKPELLENKKYGDIDYQKLLTNLNKNIREKGKLDKDHEIGHAFLINADNDENKLKRAFLNKIYPLLEEYFYGEEDTIQKVLNCKGTNYLKDVKTNWKAILQRLCNEDDNND